ncbi:hypothetical protein D3C81_644110 [compost metagenome]
MQATKLRILQRMGITAQETIETAVAWRQAAFEGSYRLAQLVRIDTRLGEHLCEVTSIRRVAAQAPHCCVGAEAHFSRVGDRV